MPLISFIVTYHNEPQWMLRDCIDSILRLPLADGEREVTVVDDGSEVSPKDVISLYSDKVRFFRQNNQGLSMARNSQVAQAQGEYIQFVDADDMLLPTYVEVLNHLRSSHPDAVKMQLTHTTKVSKATGVSYRGSGVDYLATHNLKASACSFCFKTIAMEGLPFHPRIYHEDELFSPQLLLRLNEFIEINTAAYYYRQHQGTITHSTDRVRVEKRMNDFLWIIMQLDALAKTKEGRVAEALNRRCDQLSMDYIYNMMRLRMGRQFIKSGLLQLKSAGLFPLRLKRYTNKYLAVALLSKVLNTPIPNPSPKDTPIPNPSPKGGRE